MIDLDKYLEKSLEEAEKIAKEDGLETRITKEDGCSYFITMDIRIDRINFELESGIVKDVGIF